MPLAGYEHTLIGAGEGSNFLGLWSKLFLSLSGGVWEQATASSACPQRNKEPLITAGSHVSAIKKNQVKIKHISRSTGRKKSDSGVIFEPLNQAAFDSRSTLID